MLDRRVIFAKTQVGPQAPQRRAQVDDRRRMNLRDPRFRDPERAFDILERLSLEIVERDHGPLLRRQRLDRPDELLHDLLALDALANVGEIVAQGIDQRYIVAALVGKKLFQREQGRPTHALENAVEVATRNSEVSGEFVVGRHPAEPRLEFADRAFDFTRALPNGARHPIQRSQRVENRPVDPRDRIGFELYAARIIVFFNRIDEPDDTIVYEVVNLNVGRQVRGDAPGHVFHEVKIFMDQLFARVGLAGDAVTSGRTLAHRGCSPNARWVSSISVGAIRSSGSTRSTSPATAAARGIPYTTQVASF